MSAPTTVARLSGVPVATAVDGAAAALQQVATSVTRVGSTSFTVQQTRRPVWTIVLAVLLFPIGLLFLLVKDTRVGSVSVVDEGGVVTIVVSGDVSDEVSQALSGVRGVQPTATPRETAPPPPLPSAPPSPMPAPPSSAPPNGAIPGPAAATPEAIGGPDAGSTQEDATRFRGGTAGEVAHELVPAHPASGAVVVRLPDGSTVPVPAGSSAYIGRQPTVQPGEVSITVADQQVSRTHAALRVLERRVEVVDLDSRNGVLVGTGETPLPPGEPRVLDLPTVITVGTTQLSIESRS